jgi:glucokinase
MKAARLTAWARTMIPGMAKIPAVRLGIDLGGTKIHCLVIDRKGRVLGTSRASTKASRGYAAVVERIAEVAHEAMDDAGIRRRDLKAVGIGAPGMIDPAGGVIQLAPNLGWRSKPLADDLGDELDLPVVLGNDVNFGALGEATYGGSRKAASSFAVFVGTGLGGGLVVGGRVVNGSHGFGGEIGHIPAPFGQARCGCGRCGCLETTASRTGLVRLVRQAAAAGRRCLLPTGEVRSGHLVKAYDAGCPATRAALAEMLAALGWGLATVGNVVDPEVFVIGGGVAEAFGKRLLAPLARAMTADAVLYQRHRPALRLAELGDDAVAIGAAVASGEA